MSQGRHGRPDRENLRVRTYAAAPGLIAATAVMAGMGRATKTAGAARSASSAHDAQRQRPGDGMLPLRGPSRGPTPSRLISMRDLSRTHGQPGLSCLSLSGPLESLAGKIVGLSIPWRAIGICFRFGRRLVSGWSAPAGGAIRSFCRTSGAHLRDAVAAGPVCGSRRRLTHIGVGARFSAAPSRIRVPFVQGGPAAIRDGARIREPRFRTAVASRLAVP
jgi:hypothetical protein